ncbi:hypothetical protein BGW80DRAFT_1259826 [Lactifluus volemus]|nr:hypothetical protein BGW80DRAFT_1259826 [Lactifluus volemus]
MPRGEPMLNALYLRRDEVPIGVGLKARTLHLRWSTRPLVWNKLADDDMVPVNLDACTHRTRLLLGFCQRSSPPSQYMTNQIEGVVSPSFCNSRAFDTFQIHMVRDSGAVIQK